MATLKPGMAVIDREGSINYGLQMSVLEVLTTQVKVVFINPDGQRKETWVEATRITPAKLSDRKFPNDPSMY